LLIHCEGSAEETGSQPPQCWVTHSCHTTTGKMNNPSQTYGQTQAL